MDAVLRFFLNIPLCQDWRKGCFSPDLLLQRFQCARHFETFGADQPRISRIIGSGAYHGLWNFQALPKEATDRRNAWWS